MIKRNINKISIVILLFFSFYFFFSCMENNKSIIEIGTRIPKNSIISDDTIKFRDGIYRKIKSSLDSDLIIYITDENRIFFYKCSGIDSLEFIKYYKYFNKRFSGELIIIDSSLFSEYFICKKFIWQDSINSDFAILSSCKNINDTLETIGTITWDLEVGNDTIIKKIQLSDSD